MESFHKKTATQEANLAVKQIHTEGNNKRRIPLHKDNERVAKVLGNVNEYILHRL
jgi:hypothetical protein